jgi:large subunit ribosomal protein L3
MRAAGHMGADRVTVRNVKVVGIDGDKGHLLVFGSVPGATGGYLLIRKRETKAPGRKG